ncbi:MAG: hypothetical protein DCF29_21980 [Alphaproteobacteria bacterium]|nr:MAG: hypothetical protein DCF29_21980 [Alphaproteobacteria bacterium]
MAKLTRPFRRFVVIIYWVVLPLCLAALAVSFVTVSEDGQYQPEWRLALGAALMALLVGWRLKLNSRALGAGTRFPSAGRVMTVFAPLGALAALGWLLILLGVAWVGLGIWVLSDLNNADALFPVEPDTWSAKVTAGMLMIFGLVAVCLGAVPNWFFWRLFRRRVPESTSPEAVVDLEVLHD